MDRTIPEIGVAGAEDAADQKGEKSADRQRLHVKSLETDKQYHTEKHVDDNRNQGTEDSASKG
jgi:hypothetical protein